MPKQKFNTVLTSRLTLNFWYERIWTRISGLVFDFGSCCREAEHPALGFFLWVQNFLPGTRYWPTLRGLHQFGTDDRSCLNPPSVQRCGVLWREGELNLRGVVCDQSMEIFVYLVGSILHRFDLIGRVRFVQVGRKQENDTSLPWALRGEGRGRSRIRLV